MSDEESVYRKLEIGYVLPDDKKHELVEKCNTQTSTHGSAILKVLYYNPSDLKVKHLPVKAKVKQIESNRMGNGFTTDTLASVDIQKIDKIGGVIIKTYQGVFYGENFENNHFRNVPWIFFNFEERYKFEHDEVMHFLDQ